MCYMVVYPLPDDYKRTRDNEQRIIEKFKKFFNTSKLPIERHIFDHIFNPIGKYINMCIYLPILKDQNIIKIYLLI